MHQDASRRALDTFENCGCRNPSQIFSDFFEDDVKVRICLPTENQGNGTSEVPPAEGPPSTITDAAHSKMCMNGTNHLVPSYAPAHTGPCAHPRPRHSGLLGCGKWVWGPATKWPAYAVRHKALTAQIQAPGSLFCAEQSRPRPGLRLRITSPVYGEVFRSLRPSLRR